MVVEKMEKSKKTWLPTNIIESRGLIGDGFVAAASHV